MNGATHEKVEKRPVIDRPFLTTKQTIILNFFFNTESEPINK